MTGTGLSIRAGSKAGRALETVRGVLGEGQFLKAAEKFLGKGYTSLPNCRYLSKDGLRQVRYGKHEVTSGTRHAHFEVYNKKGGQAIDNARVIIK